MSDHKNTQLPQCVKSFDEMRHALDGNGGPGLKTLMYSLRQQVSTLSDDVAALKEQGVKVQRLIWTGFGVIVALNVVMKLNLSSAIRTILGGI
jgi:hypothetical protein